MNPVVLFDGVCNLCNGAVRFVIERDPGACFKFAALQSPTGRELLARCGVPPDGLETMVLVEGERCYTQSDSALRIAAKLGGAWPLLGVLRLLPRRLRDRGYRVLADNRYNWFGKRESCMVPTQELRARFL